MIDYLVDSCIVVGNLRAGGIAGCKDGRTEMSTQGKDQYSIWSIDGPVTFSEVGLLLSASDAQLFSEVYHSFSFGKLVPYLLCCSSFSFICNYFRHWLT